MGVFFLGFLLSAVSFLCMDEAEGMDGGEGMEPTEADVAEPDQDDPLVGFLFAVGAAGVLIAMASLMVKCLRCLFKCMCGNSCASGKYPGEAMGEAETQTRTVVELGSEEEGALTKVYIGLPASHEDVPALR